MNRSSFRLSRSLRIAVYLSFGTLLFTGAGWMFAQQRLEVEAWAKMPPLLLKIHGAAAMVALMVLGGLSAHIKRGWKAAKNRLSGVMLIALNAFLIATGYGLYYAGNEELRQWLSRWHCWIGLGTFVLLPGHVIAGRLIIRRLHRRKSASRGSVVTNAASPHLP